MVTYSVTTWDTEAQAFTPQSGLSLPSSGLTLWQLKRALRELRDVYGYTCHYVRAANGTHYSNDPAVLVEREQ